MAGGRWTAAAADLIAHLDRLRRLAKKRRGKMRPAVIRPYVGYGTTERRLFTQPGLWKTSASS